jgi:hypothetical protein
MCTPTYPALTLIASLFAVTRTWHRPLWQNGGFSIGLLKDTQGCGVYRRETRRKYRTELIAAEL